jgi:murein DD-endopeptidase MepM/ murein hydrolase activator NlpD
VPTAPSFSVGWNDVGGNRLWLRDSQGNEFYYAHLSAFSPLAKNGRHVKAGEVVGFVGNTGDAQGHAAPPALRDPPGVASLHGV